VEFVGSSLTKDTDIYEKMNKKPLSCWVIMKISGEVCCAHCDCMAGLGKACSHIAAILYYLEALARIHGMRTRTHWIIQSYLKNVEYLPINFTLVRGNKRKLDDMIDSVNNAQLIPKQAARSVESEMAPLFEELNCGGTRSGILPLSPSHMYQR